MLTSSGKQSGSEHERFSRCVAACGRVLSIERGERFGGLTPFP
jgi:hypothetical protein